MSVKKRTLTYGLAAVVLAIFLVASASLLGPLAGLAGLKSAKSTTTTGSSFATNPQGTSSLNMSYSNVDVRVMVNDSSWWIPTNSSGSVDLMSIVNVSKTIAATTLPNGSVVDEIRFDISSVQITINGTVYSVTSVTDKLTVPLANSTGVKSLSAALVDLSPKVVEVVTDGNVTAFVMVPSASAIIRDSTQITSDQSHVGHESNLTNEDRDELHNINGNVSIVVSKLSVTGNVTNFSIQIANNGNTSIALSAIALNGEFNGTFNQAMTCSATSTSADPHSVVNFSNDQSSSHDGDWSNSTTTADGSTTSTTTSVQSGDSTDGTTSTTSAGVSGQDAIFLPADVQGNISNTMTWVHSSESHSWANDSWTSLSGDRCAMSWEQPHFSHEMIFTTSVNSTTMVPVMGSNDGEHDVSPLIIQPNQTVTLSFKGVINATYFGGEDGDFHSQSTLVMYPISGNTYEVNLALSSEADAAAQVIAS